MTKYRLDKIKVDRIQIWQNKFEILFSQIRITLFWICLMFPREDTGGIGWIYEICLINSFDMLQFIGSNIALINKLVFSLETGWKISWVTVYSLHPFQFPLDVFQRGRLCGWSTLEKGQQSNRKANNSPMSCLNTKKDPKEAGSRNSNKEEKALMMPLLLIQGDKDKDKM